MVRELIFAKPALIKAPVLPNFGSFTFDLQRFADYSQKQKYRGNRRWSGNWGRLWWDNELIFEIESYEAKVSTDREDIYIDQSIDSKIVGLKGEGKIKIKRVINRNMQKLLSAWSAGEDPRAQLVGLIADPDAPGKQQERISFDNVWFNELTLMAFEKGKTCETEYPFGFTVEDVRYLDAIN